MRVRPGLTLTAILLFLCPALATAQPLADRVPADALVYVGWSGSDSMGPGYAASHLKAVLDESKFAELINVTIPKLMAKAGAGDRQAAQVTQLVSAIGGPMVRHPTAFYFGGIDMPAGGQGQPMPRVALLCDAGTEGKALADQIRNLLAQAPKPNPVKVEEQDGFVVVSVGAANWGAAQKPAAPLSTAKAFTAAVAQVQKDSVAALYVDVEGIVKLADQLIGQGEVAARWQSARDALGLGGIKRVICTAGFDGKEWSEQAFIEAPAPRTGVLPGLLESTPLSDDILKAIPQSATVAAAGKFDLGGLVKAIRAGVAKLDPNAGEMVAGVIGQVNQVLGFDVQADLFDVFGDEWAVYVDPMATGNGLLGFTLVNKARDAKKLEASLTKLEDMANALIKQNMKDAQLTLEFKRAPVGGTTLHLLAIPLVAPCWAAKDGNVYLGLYPQVVEAAIEQGGGKNKSILDNEDYVALRKRLGSQPASGITFANLPKTAAEGYQEMLLISRLYFGMIDLAGGDTPPMLLPPLRKIMPHLTPAGGVSWADAAGWHHKALSPFPLSGALMPGGGGQAMVAQGALMTSIMLPSLNKAREQANKVKCAANMSSLYKGMYLYSVNNKQGKFPPDLGTIYLEEEMPDEVFFCPTNDRRPPRPVLGAGDKPDDFEKWRKDVAKWINENSDYVYLGAGLNNSVAADVIVLHEKPDAHRAAGMNLVYGDGHVVFERMDEAMRQIEKQKAAKKDGAK